MYSPLFCLISSHACFFVCVSTARLTQEHNRAAWYEQHAAIGAVICLADTNTCAVNWLTTENILPNYIKSSNSHDSSHRRFLYTYIHTESSDKQLLINLKFICLNISKENIN